MSEIPEVPFQIAYRWHCPECGRENFDRGERVELEGQDLEDARSSFGVEPWEDGEFCAAPSTVTCSGCLLLCSLATDGPDE